MKYGSPKTGLPETTGLSHAIVVNACEPDHKEGDGPQIPSVRVKNELPGQILDEMSTSSVLSFAISLSFQRRSDHTLLQMESSTQETEHLAGN